MRLAAPISQKTPCTMQLGSLDPTRRYWTHTTLSRRVARYRWHGSVSLQATSCTPLMLLEWMYAKSPTALYVNLFAGSQARIDGIAGTTVSSAARGAPGRTVTITLNPASGGSGLHRTSRRRTATRARLQALPSWPLARPPVLASTAVRRRVPSAAGMRAVCPNATEAGRPRGGSYSPELQQRSACGPTNRIRQLRVAGIALQLRPLICNIEHHEQDIGKRSASEGAVEARVEATTCSAASSCSASRFAGRHAADGHLQLREDEPGDGRRISAASAASNPDGTRPLRPRRSRSSGSRFTRVGDGPSGAAFARRAPRARRRAAAPLRLGLDHGEDMQAALDAPSTLSSRTRTVSPIRRLPAASFGDDFPRCFRGRSSGRRGSRSMGTSPSTNRSFNPTARTRISSSR